MATSYASSSPQLKALPKDLLQVLCTLKEENKIKAEEWSEQEIQQQYSHHLQSHRQHHDQKKYEQRQLDESERKTEKSQTQQRMELSQIDLIYRAEGNANLVVALPQFKKVLRLPKISYQETQYCQKSSPKNKQLLLQEQMKQQEKIYQQEPNKTTGQQKNEIDAVGILTMDHYVAYINIIRCLVGNEFVFEADVVAVPNPTDRQWINEHIKPYRPANRLDKEFGGHFGLLLPDATQLPAEFDFLLCSNLQQQNCKNQPETATTATAKIAHCSNNSSITDKSCSKSNNIFGSDTFAIEIKPKQGWLLPNDVNNLFDIRPKIIQTKQPPSLCETKKALKAAVVTTATSTESKASKTLTDTEYCTTIQEEQPSQIMVAATSTTTTTTFKNVPTRITKTSQTEVTKTSRCCSSDNTNKTTTTPRDDKISHSFYDKVDIRCRYCCMQFLKLKQHKIFKRNQYCPLDLFSGSAVKMINAIDALLDCPQNNLRIFKNGQLFFDDQISTTTNIIDIFSSDKLQLIKHLLVTCLLRDYENKEKAKNIEKEQINKDTTKQQLLSSTTALVLDVGGVQEGDACGNQDEEEADGKGEVTVGSGSDADAGVSDDGQPHSSVTSCKQQKIFTLPKTKAKTDNTTNTETEVTKVKSTLTSVVSQVSVDNTLMSASDNNTQCLQQIIEAEVTCLPKNCVLQKILHLQTLAKIHFQFMLDHEYADKNKKTYDIVCKMLKRTSKTNNKLTLGQLSPEEQYILAATALDCSIMITFCAIENVLEDKRGQESERKSLIDSPHVVSIFGQTFLTKVTILDLDPKSDAHFNKYCLQTKQIYEAIKSHS